MIFASVYLYFAAAPQDDLAHPDPIAAIRAMVNRGEFADAAEALAGLPDPMRTRESVYLLFKSYDLRRAYEQGERSLQNDPNDVETLRILGDIDAMEKRLRRARQRYTAAKEAFDKDSHLTTDAARESEERLLQFREPYLAREEKYQESVAAAVRNSRSWAGLCIVLMGLLGAGGFLTFLRRNAK